MKGEIQKEIAFPSGVTVQLEGSMLTVKGPKGTVQRNFLYPKVMLRAESGKVFLAVAKGTKREKKVVGSFASHIRNMVQGVQQVHEYKLKVCSGHFPMNVSISGRDFIIKNFLGEAVPRRVTLPQGADVKVQGEEVVITSVDKELAGRVAGLIERLCRITNRDLRIFQDGCYITHKAGKAI